ncbi:MAG: chorismate lyase [Pseudomonadota bacterium]
MSCLVWKNLFQETSIPVALQPWLANADSMTRALEEASGVPCQMVVQKEGWQMPWPDECEALSLNEECWIREVVIMTRQPTIFARSVFPRKLIEQFPKLMALGSQPLGKILFSGDSTFQRGPIEVTEISIGQSLWEQIPKSLRPETCWARRSLFHSTVSSFLLSEVLLLSSFA